MSLINILLQLSQGMLFSILIFSVTLILSLPLGLLVAFARMSKIKAIRIPASIYISIMRGTPLMLQLMVVYFGPYYIFGIKVVDNYRIIAALIGFVINYAAYFAEIYRGGIQSIGSGQYEAAKLLGYNKIQTFTVIKRILPSITNEVITLIKDTSLAFTISVLEMFSRAKALASSSTSMMPFVVAACIYYVFNFIVEFIMNSIEKRLNYYR